MGSKDTHNNKQNIEPKEQEFPNELTFQMTQGWNIFHICFQILQFFQTLYCLTYQFKSKSDG